MRDVEIAKAGLEGHTVCLCKDGKITVSDLRGVAPVLQFIKSGKDLSDCSVADKVVGKAAALLFVKAGIKEVFARVLSQAGAKILEKYSVPYTYEVLAERIINREGTDICPMEKAVRNTFDPEEAYALICTRLEELKREKESER